MSEHFVVITTCSDRDSAKSLAAKMIKAKLAACVQLDEIESFYEWQGEVENGSEVRLMIKTQAFLYAELEVFIKEHHSYEVPEIIALPIQAGSKEYLSWIDDETTS